MKLDDGVLISKLGEKCVIYENERSVLHEVNEEGYVILNGLEKGLSRKEIVEQIIEEYEVTRNEAERDYEEFLLELRRLGLVRKEK